MSYVDFPPMSDNNHKDRASAPSHSISCHLFDLGFLMLVFGGNKFLLKQFCHWCSRWKVVLVKSQFMYRFEIWRVVWVKKWHKLYWNVYFICGCTNCPDPVDNQCFTALHPTYGETCSLHSAGSQQLRKNSNSKISNSSRIWTFRHSSKRRILSSHPTLCKRGILPSTSSLPWS